MFELSQRASINRLVVCRCRNKFECIQRLAHNLLQRNADIVSVSVLTMRGVSVCDTTFNIAVTIEYELLTHMCDV